MGPGGAGFGVFFEVCIWGELCERPSPPSGVLTVSPSAVGLSLPPSPLLRHCPRPQAPAEAKAQAGRRYLGLRQGLTLPGWFFAGIARGEGKGK